MRIRKLAGVMLLALFPLLTTAEGRFQAVAVPEGQEFGSGKVLIIDTDTGNIWTWMEVSATPAGPGGRFLIYQGQVRPGKKMGDVIEHQEWAGAH